MPVLVSHVDHTDCEVCAHAAIPGLGTTAPKSPEEHERTCCSPEAIEGRKHLEDQAQAALDADRREREEAQKRREKAAERMAEIRAAAPDPVEDAAYLAALAASKRASEQRRRQVRQPTGRLRFEVRQIKAKIDRRLRPVPEFAKGTSNAAWFGSDDPTVTDLFAQAQPPQPSRLQRLRALVRR